MEDELSKQEIIKLMVNKAKQASKNKDHQKAIQILTNILALEPNSIKNVMRLIKECRKAQQNDKAIQYIKMYLQQYPQNIQVLQIYLKILRQQGNKDLCQKILIDKLQRFPLSAQHMVLYADLLYQNREYSLAAQLYEATIQLKPNPQYKYDLAHCLFNIKKFPQAQKLYLQCIDQDDKRSDYFAGYGILLFELNRLQQSQKMFKKCLQIQPEHEVCLFSYGILCSKTGRLEQAQKNMNKSVLKCPQDNTLKQMRQSILNNKSQQKLVNIQERYIKQLQNQNQQKTNKIYQLYQNLQRKDKHIQQLQMKLKVAENKLQQIQRQKKITQERNRQKGLCKICLYNKAIFVNKQCGHVCLCKSCVKAWNRECPLCRKSGSYVSVYSSMIGQSQI